MKKPKSKAADGMCNADTTRSPRAGEIDGREYNFTTRDDFLRLVAENGFLEHAQFGGNHYGTSVKAVKDVAEKGKVCVLDIEMEVSFKAPLPLPSPSLFPTLGNFGDEKRKSAPPSLVLVSKSPKNQKQTTRNKQNLTSRPFPPPPLPSPPLLSPSFRELLAKEDGRRDQGVVGDKRGHGHHQGVKQVQATDLNARILFLYPPSIKVLEERLRGRGTENEDSLQKRLQQAEVEMAFAKEAGEKIVLNDDLDRAYGEVEEWVVDGGKFGD